MHAPEIAISATCVRGRVKIGHKARLFSVEFSRPMSADERQEHPVEGTGVAVMTTPPRGLIPYPEIGGPGRTLSKSSDPESASHPTAVLWVVERQHTEGAALNAVQFAEKLVGK